MIEYSVCKQTLKMKLKNIHFKENCIVWGLDKQDLELYALPRSLVGFIPNPNFLTVVIDNTIKGVLRCPSCSSQNIRKSRYEGKQINQCNECTQEFNELDGEVR